MNRTTYANVTSTIALVLTMAGGAVAANHYIITSTSQIKPSVRAQLRGARGPEGVQGPLGPQGLRGLGGPAGPSGQDGARGPFGPTGLQGYAGRNGENGIRGEPGCGQAPDVTWEASQAYLQGCTRYTMQGSQWRKVADNGKKYLCIKGVEHDGEQGIYCRSTKSPSEQIAENPETAEWSEAP